MFTPWQMLLCHRIGTGTGQSLFVLCPPGRVASARIGPYRWTRSVITLATSKWPNSYCPCYSTWSSPPPCIITIKRSYTHTHVFILQWQSIYLTKCWNINFKTWKLTGGNLSSILRKANKRQLRSVFTSKLPLVVDIGFNRVPATQPGITHFNWLTRTFHNSHRQCLPVQPSRPPQTTVAIS